MAASDTEDDRGAALEQLSGYLDVVETQLLKEIAVRLPGPGLLFSMRCAAGFAGADRRPPCSHPVDCSIVAVAMS